VAPTLIIGDPSAIFLASMKQIVCTKKYDPPTPQTTNNSLILMMGPADLPSEDNRRTAAQDLEAAQVESPCDPGPPDENSQRNGADSMITEQAGLAPKACPSGMDQQWEEG